MEVQTRDVIVIKRRTTLYTNIDTMITRGRVFTSRYVEKGSIGLILKIQENHNLVEILTDGIVGAVVIDACEELIQAS